MTREDRIKYNTPFKRNRPNNTQDNRIFARLHLLDLLCGRMSSDDAMKLITGSTWSKLNRMITAEEER